MSRPYYESNGDRANESAAMRQACSVWGLDFHKLPISYRLDYALTSNDLIKGFAEVNFSADANVQLTHSAPGKRGDQHVLPKPARIVIDGHASRNNTTKYDISSAQRALTKKECRCYARPFEGVVLTRERRGYGRRNGSGNR